MKNNHLTYFKIENFKKFDSLEVNDIGQFNLIVGDNNVGKTCLLEALLFDEDSQQLLNNFYLALTKRGLKFQIEEITRKANGISTTEILAPKENYFKEYIFSKQEELKIYYKINETLSTLTLNASRNNISIGFKQLENTSVVNIYKYDLKILNFPLITFNDSSINNITIDLYNNLDIEGEEILLNTLKILNPNLFKIGFKKEFEDLQDVFVLSFKSEKKLIPLNFLGDGFKRIFYIVLKALSLKGKRILIDEIEIGIHYSKMKDFWINLMKVCKELEVQLFATTHSQECTEAYIQAANLLNYNNYIRLIKLEESSNKDKIYASTFTYNQINAGLDSNVELRG